MMSIHDGHRKRMKIRFLREGLDNFNDINVLELLLFFVIPRKDTNSVAHALLRRFGSISTVLDAPIGELRKVPEIGESAATLLSLIPQVAKRYQIDRSRVGVILDTTKKCGDYLLPHFFGARDEMVYLLCMDAKCKVLDCRLLTKGSLNTVGISVRKIVETALACNATSVVLAHNHTSGIALPSREDEVSTRLIQRALDTVDILLADHIVIADEDYVSMRDNGTL